MKKLMVLVAALSLAAASQAVPAQFSYQGVLHDSAGAPMSGPQQVELRLYDVASGSKSALWGRTYAVQLDANGLFNIEVSDTTGTAISGEQYDQLASVFATTNTLYIGLKVNGSSGEIVPRQKLLPVPFAAVAGDVSRASGNFTISGRLVAQSADFTSDLTASNVNVSSSVSAQSLEVRGDATVQGALSVQGTITGFGTVPPGAIIMWSGQENEIPEGWYLCNGKNGTPDLRNRFIVGAGTGSEYTIGKTGGEKNVTLTEKQIPSHSHTYKFKAASFSGAWKYAKDFYSIASGWDELQASATTETAGSGQAHENRPPFYPLCFIMRGQ